MWGSRENFKKVTKIFTVFLHKKGKISRLLPSFARGQRVHDGKPREIERRGAEVSKTMRGTLGGCVDHEKSSKY